MLRKQTGFVYNKRLNCLGSVSSIQGASSLSIADMLSSFVRHDGSSIFTSAVAHSLEEPALSDGKRSDFTQQTSSQCFDKTAIKNAICVAMSGLAPFVFASVRDKVVLDLMEENESSSEIKVQT